MLTAIHPKLPMRDKAATLAYYTDKLGFTKFGRDYDNYLMVNWGELQLHFFLFADLDVKENYGQVYIRTNEIEKLYQSFIDKGVEIHPNGHLQLKPWGQKEFALLDPDKNLLTFGQSV